jgi:hypothetical protein
LKKSAAKQIKQILLLLMMAVLSAGFLSAIFLYLYNPSGQYSVNKTLIDPIVLEQLQRRETLSSTKEKRDRFVLDTLEFSYFDLRLNRRVVYPVKWETYQELYKLISSQKSLPLAAEKKDQLFQGSPILLTIKLSSEVKDKISQKILQIVQFSSDDYFRIRLLGDERDEQWAYFYKPGIYEQVFSLFTTDQN